MDTMNPKGSVTITVYDKYGNIKEIQEQHNIITSQGDAYIADRLSLVPVRQIMDATHTFIAVGTGYTGVSNKTKTWVNTQVGPAQIVSTGYPKLVGLWGATGQNQVQYQFNFISGVLNATGINEAALVSAAVTDVTTTCLAYVHINSINVYTSDSLAITWNISFLGA
jgi:hypothetical protein